MNRFPSGNLSHLGLLTVSALCWLPLLRRHLNITYWLAQVGCSCAEPKWILEMKQFKICLRTPLPRNMSKSNLRKKERKKQLRTCGLGALMQLGLPLPFPWHFPPPSKEESLLVRTALAPGIQKWPLPSQGPDLHMDRWLHGWLLHPLAGWVICPFSISKHLYSFHLPGIARNAFS